MEDRRTAVYQCLPVSWEGELGLTWPGCRTEQPAQNPGLVEVRGIKHHISSARGCWLLGKGEQNKHSSKMEASWLSLSRFPRFLGTKMDLGLYLKYQ